jgi:hypothetical protein
MQITKALFFELVTPTSAAMFAFELRNMVCQIFWPKAKQSDPRKEGSLHTDNKENGPSC